MAIPHSEHIDSLINSIRIDPPSEANEWLVDQLVPSETVIDGTRHTTLPSIQVWSPKGSAAGVESLLRRIRQELRYLGHSDDEEIAKIVLAIFLHTRSEHVDELSRLNDILSANTSADLNQYLLSDIRVPNEYTFRVGPFHIGPFVPRRLEYQCRKAGSDFFDRYRSSLYTNGLSIERNHFSVSAILWNSLIIGGVLRPRNSRLNAILARLIDRYYFRLSAIYFDDFVNTLYEVQEVAIALGSEWFDLRRLQELSKTTLVSVYLNMGGGSFGVVSPRLRLLDGITLGRAHVDIPAVEKLVSDDFGFLGFDGSQFLQTIKQYVRFLAIASDHRYRNQRNQGFLHEVIALDLLLGEEGASNKSVTTRSAVLAHRGLGHSFSETLKQCQSLYASRSKYVHEGEPPEEKQIRLATRITREIATCLLRLQRNSDSHSSGFLNKWLKHVDYAAAAYKADRSPSIEDIVYIGLPMEGDVIYTDVFKKLSGKSLLE